MGHWGCARVAAQGEVYLMGVAGAVAMAVEENVNGGTKGHKGRMI